MEGPNGADDMRSSHKEEGESFIFSLFRFGFRGRSARIGIATYYYTVGYNNARSIPGAIDELCAPVGHQQAVFVSGPDRLTQVSTRLAAAS